MKNYLSKIGAYVSVMPILFLPSGVFAQVTKGNPDAGLKEVGKSISGQGKGSDLPTVIANLINTVIGILGIIFVVQVVYAGWLYFSAMGDDGKVKTAKTMLTRAIMGLVLILSAYAIATFVIQQVTGISE